MFIVSLKLLIILKLFGLSAEQEGFLCPRQASKVFSDIYSRIFFFFLMGTFLIEKYEILPYAAPVGLPQSELLIKLNIR